MPHLNLLHTRTILPLIAIGFAARLVDGAPGVAFGVIRNVLLVTVIGVAPVRASANVHIVASFTTAVSGLSHALHGNIDRKLFVRLLVPGLIGGVAGAYVLVGGLLDAVGGRRLGPDGNVELTGSGRRAALRHAHRQLG